MGNILRIRRTIQSFFFLILICCTSGIANASLITQSVTEFIDPGLTSVRKIVVEYVRPDRSFPCRVLYHKNGNVNVVAYANNTPGICERVEKEMIANMKNAYSQIIHEVKMLSPKPDFDVWLDPKQLNKAKSLKNAAQILLEEFTKLDDAEVYSAAVKRQFPNLTLRVVHVSDQQFPYKIAVSDNLPVDYAEKVVSELKQVGLAKARTIADSTSWLKDTVTFSPDWQRYAIASCFSEGNTTVRNMAECSGLELNNSDITNCLNGGSCTPAKIINSKDIESLSQQKLIDSLSTQVDPRVANCLNKHNSRNSVLNCGMKAVMNKEQLALYNCQQQYSSKSDIASCSAKQQLPPEVRDAIQCIENSRQSNDHAVNCVIEQIDDENVKIAAECIRADDPEACLIGSAVGGDASKAIECAKKYPDDNSAMALCLVGPHLNQSQQRALECAQNSSSIGGFAACNALGGLNLTPEQQIALECAMNSGGQPYAAAACYGIQTTIRELTKCFTNGIGGEGCFGKNNTLVKLATNQFNDLTKGPGKGNEIVKIRDKLLGDDQGEIAILLRDPMKRTLKIVDNVAKGVLKESGKLLDATVVKPLKEIKKHTKNAIDDVTKGPGENNDVVGRKGWLRSRLGF